MKITSPYYDADSNHLVYDIAGGPRGWLVTVSDDLDGAFHCDTMEECIEGIVNHTAALGKTIITDNLLSIARKFISQGLSGEDILEQMAAALKEETTQ